MDWRSFTFNKKEIIPFRLICDLKKSNFKVITLNEILIEVFFKKL